MVVSAILDEELHTDHGQKLGCRPEEGKAD